MIKYYIEKASLLWLLQDGKCAGCGKPIQPIYYDNELHDSLTGEKLDLDHILRKTKGNMRNYPLFINSLFIGGIWDLT